MRDPIPATLIYNPDAGGSGRARPTKLYKQFQQIGIRLNHRKTESAADIERVLPNGSEPVVVMGGDGTVRAVMRALLGRSNPLIILPGGKANNIARSFGLMKRNISENIAALGDPIRRPVDVGQIDFPWNERVTFMEAVGFGLVADIMANYDPEKERSFTRGLQAMIDEFSKHSNYRTRIRVDGEEFAADFRLVEVLNTPAFGPRLAFSPKARMTDGRFGIVIADEDLPAAEAITALLARRFHELSAVRNLDGEQVEIEWTDFPLHVDGRVQPNREVRARLEEEPLESTEIKIRVLHNAITLWLPNLSEENGRGN